MCCREAWGLNLRHWNIRRGDPVSFTLSPNPSLLFLHSWCFMRVTFFFTVVGRKWAATLAAVGLARCSRTADFDLLQRFGAVGACPGTSTWQRSVPCARGVWRIDPGVLPRSHLWLLHTLPWVSEDGEFLIWQPFSHLLGWIFSRSHGVTFDYLLSCPECLRMVSSWLDSPFLICRAESLVVVMELPLTIYCLAPSVWGWWVFDRTAFFSFVGLNL